MPPLRPAPFRRGRESGLMGELRLGRVTYHGGFSFIQRTGLNGGLVLDDDAVRMVGVQNEKLHKGFAAT